MFCRKEIYSIEEVLPFTYNKALKGRLNLRRRVYDGDTMGMCSDRYTMFKRQGLTCVICGVTGSFFAKEKNEEKANRYHFNLYAVREDGTEVLMTKDHIIPKCLGGRDIQSNYQPMCAPCNQKKGCEENPHNEERYQARLLRRELETAYRERMKALGWVWFLKGRKFSSSQNMKKKKILDKALALC